MIHPDLATMLAVVTTDYPLQRRARSTALLRPAVDASFNAISVDGDCSTNDMVLAARERRERARAHRPRPTRPSPPRSHEVCADLARQIVADGEGVTVLAEITVDGAADGAQAKAIARRIATSPLVKTALFGHDANWGRVLMAAGSAPYNGGYADIDEGRATLAYNGTVVYDRGTPTGVEPDVVGPELHDHARARPRQRHRELPDLRPLARLRAHQRGLPVVTRLVVKVGGAVAAESAGRILGLREEGHEVIVVHGAGPQITDEMKSRGIPVEFVNGRRRTSRAALDVVRESLVSVNAELCAALGDVAVPVIGDEAGLFAVPVPPLGWVGDPLPCRPKPILDALAAGLIPVVAPLAVGPLNVNADDASAALALGLGAGRLVFLTDVAGLYLDDVVVDAIRAIDANRLLDEGAFEGGIVPKLRAAAIAAASGITAEIGATAVVA